MVETANEPRERSQEVAWLVIGLGNPGPRYRETYHNVGFRVVELLARRWGVSMGLRIGEAVVARVPGSRRALVEPLTFMNRSGAVLGTLFDRFGPDSRLLVISDDVALPVGRLRIRERGSAGGHNGLKSIGSALGSDDYIRVRVGILSDRGPGRVSDKVFGMTGDMKDFVLSRVRKADRDLLAQCEDLAADAVEGIISTGVRDAMSRYNGIDLREV